MSDIADLLDDEKYDERDASAYRHYLPLGVSLVEIQAVIDGKDRDGVGFYVAETIFKKALKGKEAQQEEKDKQCNWWVGLGRFKDNNIGLFKGFLKTAMQASGVRGTGKELLGPSQPLAGTVLKVHVYTKGESSFKHHKWMVPTPAELALLQEAEEAEASEVEDLEL